MATVRAATQAMTRRQQRLQEEAEAGAGAHLIPSSKASPPNPSSIASPLHPFQPLATSSPEVSAGRISVGVCAGGSDRLHLAPHPPSPTASDAGSTLSLPDELSWYRHQHYVAPEKLQIVKPLEGSVTLLKWKLLASPQLGGATSFFSDATRPGVHMKGWKAAGIVDNKSQDSGMESLAPELRLKSLSTSDLSYLSSPPHPPPLSSSHPHTSTFSHSQHVKGHRRAEVIQNRPGLLPLAKTISSDAKGSHDPEVKSHDGEKESHEPEAEEGGQKSLLRQVGSLFGWSRLRLGSRGSGKTGVDRQVEGGGGGGDGSGGRERREEVDSPGPGEALLRPHSHTADMGLAGIL